MLTNAKCQADASREYRRDFRDELVVRLVPPEGSQPEQNEAQVFDLFAGTKLIGCNSDHSQIKNGDMLLVRMLKPTSAMILNEDSGEIFELSHAGVMKHARLLWAITITASQGRTLRGKVTLWDLHSRFFTTTHLYVAASRCTGADMFQVASE